MCNIVDFLNCEIIFLRQFVAHILCITKKTFELSYSFAFITFMFQRIFI